MSTEDYHKLPKLMQEFSVHCHYHKRKFEIYYRFHDCPCCIQCITDKHTKCQEMKPLSDILKQFKSSASVHHLEKEMDNVKENFKTMIKYLNGRLSLSNDQKIKGLYEIQSVRSQIDAFLNKLEQNIIDNLEFQHSKLTSKTNTILIQLHQQTEKISQLQNQFSKITQYATELQIYVSLREIDKTTSQAAQYIEDLKNGDNFDEKCLEVTISSELQSILKDVKSFGDIKTNSRPYTIQVKAGRKDQAQYLVPVIPTIEQIKPVMQRPLTIPVHMKYEYMFACRILPDNTYLVLNGDYYYKYLALFRNDGIFLRVVVNLESSSLDVCFVRNKTVAVTLGIDNQIALVNVERNKIVKRFNLSHNCDAVASDGQMLVISGKVNHIQRSTLVNLNDETHKVLEIGAGRIALFNGNIYGTIYKEVCCYKITGELLWKFTHNKVGYSDGLALDKNGFVYIASSAMNVVMVVSPDGKIYEIILSAADGIQSPGAMDINRDTGIMIVPSRISIENNSNDNVDQSYQIVFVYKI
ncbi:uncharacterized protein LOC134710234 [Mytilus trossulus]|uniref:uncharacterized protein LOC134710234 n=1 Tax=Mytilus trossulus TaxID=6551 RepID=UPI003005567F